MGFDLPSGGRAVESCGPRRQHPYLDLSSLEVGEPAVGDTMRSKTKSAAVRVGTTAAIGVVMLPVAVPLLFVKGGSKTGFALRTDTAEVFLLHVSDVRPEEWRMRLSEVFVKVSPSRTGSQPAKDAPAVSEDKVSQLERLGKLREQGVLTDEEMQRLKATCSPTNERPRALQGDPVTSTHDAGLRRQCSPQF